MSEERKSQIAIETNLGLKSLVGLEARVSHANNFYNVSVDS